FPGLGKTPGRFVVSRIQGKSAIDLVEEPRDRSGNILGEGATVRGLYSFDGKRLQLCLGNPDGKRPSELISDSEGKITVLTLERETSGDGTESDLRNRP